MSRDITVGRRAFLKTLGAGAALSALPGCLRFASRAAGPTNVLFIAVDDLRPELGCYGHPLVQSPHIDRLARTGTVFTRAYCQEAVCAPSRASLLSGLRPDSTRVWNLETPLRTVRPDVVTLPQLFRTHGYATLSTGKIYHHHREDPEGWTEEISRSGAVYANPDNVALTKRRLEEARARGLKGREAGRASMGPATECGERGDDVYIDAHTARTAIEKLDAVGDQPFFLAVGFIRPHLPFTAPRKYWEWYRRDEIPLPDLAKPAHHAPMAFINSAELRTYTDIPPVGPIDDAAKIRELIHGYYAAVSYTDAQVGRLLDALDRRGLTDRTLVILWGDHGWKLGEYGEWAKHTNVEYDTRVPMIVRVPGLTRGATCDALTEFVDIYPTLAELCGLPAPDNCEGLSYVPLLRDPRQPWKSAAFSQYPRPGPLMGYSVRTDRWRYTEWRQRDTGAVTARELYDQSQGPFVRANLADSPEHQTVVREMAAVLQAGWRGACPPRSDASRPAWAASITTSYHEIDT